VYFWYTVGMVARIVVGFGMLCVSLLAGAPLVTYAVDPAVRADMVHVHTNIERYVRGLPILKTNALLSSVAEQKMRDLFTRQYFAHDAPTGEDVSDLADGVGYEYLAVGENLAMGDFASSKDVVRAWMESKGHRENILSATYTEIGIASGKSTYKGNTIWMVVQTFGLPKTACPVVDPDMRSELEDLRTKLEMIERILSVREARVKATRTSDALYLTHLNAYNSTVTLYNTYVAEHREKVARFNEEVDAFNVCLKQRVSTS
jgi:hypothetical protein